MTEQSESLGAVSKNERATETAGSPLTELLYRLILRHKRLCMSQASMALGFGFRALLDARNELERRGLIRPAAGMDQTDLPDTQRIYEARFGRQ